MVARTGMRRWKSGCALLRVRLEWRGSPLTVADLVATRMGATLAATATAATVAWRMPVRAPGADGVDAELF